jgi:hypothetical protein
MGAATRLAAGSRRGDGHAGGCGFPSGRAVTQRVQNRIDSRETTGNTKCKREHNRNQDRRGS